MTKYNKKDIIFALLFMMFIVTGVMTLTIYCKPIFYYSIDLFNISERSSMSVTDIRANYDAVINYYIPFSNSELILPTLPMSVEGKIHFEEVKNIFMIIVYTFMVLCPIMIWIVILNIKNKTYDYLKLTAIFSVIIPTLMAILIALNWNMVFVGLHKLFFRNDYWVFNYVTDPIILMLPNVFFMFCAIIIIIGIILSSLLCFLAYKILLSKKEIVYS